MCSPFRSSNSTYQRLSRLRHRVSGMLGYPKTDQHAHSGALLFCFSPEGRTSGAAAEVFQFRATVVPGKKIGFV